MKRVKKSIEKISKIVENLDQAKYILRLYVTGMTPKSTLAIDNVQNSVKNTWKASSNSR